MQDPNIAWAAGFFEGEGHVKCARRRNVRRTDRYFSITIAQVYREPLDAFVEILGGKVYGPYGPYKTTKQAYYVCTIYGQPARDACELMLPWLYRKGEQVRAALDEWNEYQDDLKKNSGVRSGMGADESLRMESLG